MLELGDSQPLWGNAQAQYCLGETRSKLKLRVSPREKLILTHRLAIKEAWAQTTRAEPHPKGKSFPFSHKEEQYSLAHNPTYQP
jgi:hypothetical protein